MAKTRGIEDLDNEGNDTPQMRTNHLLLIGIDEYSNDISPLNNAVRDALAFKKILLDKYDFEKENIIELLDKKATGENILDTFEKLTGKLTSDDNLLIYFSGHGIFNKSNKRGYWIPVDAINNRRITYINNTEITDFLSNTKAHHVFTIIDSCFSEALFMRSVNNDSAQRVDRYPSRWALSAGRLEPVSDGSMGANSPFSQVLLKYLETETENVLWANDICNFVVKNVAFNANQTPRGEALPGVGHMGGQFIFRKKGFTEPVKEDKIESEEPTRNLSQPTNETPPVQNVEPTPNPPQPIPQTMEEWRDQIKLLIATDLNQAMVALNAGFNRAEDKYNDLILLRARHNSAKTDAQRGVVTLGQQNMMFNQIRYAIIEMVDDMEEGDLKHFKIQRS